MRASRSPECEQVDLLNAEFDMGRKEHSESFEEMLSLIRTLHKRLSPTIQQVYATAHHLFVLFCLVSSLFFDVSCLPAGFRIPLVRYFRVNRIDLFHLRQRRANSKDVNDYAKGRLGNNSGPVPRAAAQYAASKLAGRASVLRSLRQINSSRSQVLYGLPSYCSATDYRMDR